MFRTPHGQKYEDNETSHPYVIGSVGKVNLKRLSNQIGEIAPSELPNGAEYLTTDQRSSQLVVQGFLQGSG